MQYGVVWFYLGLFDLLLNADLNEDNVNICYIIGQENLEMHIIPTLGQKHITKMTLRPCIAYVWFLAAPKSELN